jgi:hypothetical protein
VRADGDGRAVGDEACGPELVVAEPDRSAWGLDLFDRRTTRSVDRVGRVAAGRLGEQVGGRSSGCPGVVGSRRTVGLDLLPAETTPQNSKPTTTVTFNDQQPYASTRFV